MPTPTKPSKTEFGAWLRKQRKDRNYTLVQMGKILTISTGGLSYMEQGKWGVLDAQIKRMAKYFRVKESFIRSLEGYDIPPGYKGTGSHNRPRKAKEMMYKDPEWLNTSDLQWMQPEQFAKAVDGIACGKVKYVR